MKFRTNWWLTTMAIMALILFIGCSDDDDPVSLPPAGHDAEATIGDGGGEISIPNQISLEIPAGALTEDIDFTMDDISSSHNDTVVDRSIISPVFSIGPDGQSFASMVDLVISYDPADLNGADASGLVIYTDAGAGWRPLATTVNEMGSFASVEVDHLSLFCVTAPIPPQHDAEATIGSDGGTIGLPNQVLLYIDAGALAADVDFTIDELESGYSEMPAGRMLVSQVWDIGPEGTTFSSAAGLAIKYDESLLTTQSETDLAIFTDEGSGWVPVVTSIDDGMDVAEADIDHLSHFCVTAPLPAVEPEDITLVATPNLPIPDGPNGGGPGPVATSTINVTAAGTLEDIRIYVNLTHGYSSDLIIKLETPGGTLHNVFWIGEGGEPNTNPVGWYPDDFTPKQDFALLDGESTAGDWKLHCYDYSHEQAGTLNEWRLNLIYQPVGK